MQENSVNLLCNMLIEQPVLQEHLITTSRAFSATSLSVIIGMKYAPDTFQPVSGWQILSSPHLYLLINSVAEALSYCRRWRQCLRLNIESYNGTYFLAEFLQPQLIVSPFGLPL